jgi:exopolysaccharide biosynthesis polyprenyl glycosylphosphotransferase
MLRQRTRNLQAAVALADAAATALAFALAYYLGGRLLQSVADMKTVLPVDRYLWLPGLAVPLWWVLFGLFGAYDFSPIERTRDSLKRLALPLLVGALAVGAAMFFIKSEFLSRRVIGAFLAANILLILLTRLALLMCAPRFYHATGALRRVLVIGGDATALAFGASVERAGWGLQLAGYLLPSDIAPAIPPDRVLGPIEDLPILLDETAIDDVVLASPGMDPGALQRVIRQCEEVGVCIHIPSHFFDAALSRPHIEVFGGVPMLTFSAAPYNPVALALKRAIDLLGSILLGALLSPLFLGIALAIRLTSRGPVIFRQLRCGLYGREFVLYKFRTMAPDAESRRHELEAANEMRGPAFKMKDDPRITPLGRFLRRHSLDELPQLWNVFTGDMSLIGPRPPLPAEVRKYQRWQRRRLSMRPGLACIWQVTDRNRATFESWMEKDLYYIDHWSLWLDAQIAVKTLPVVIRGTGM